MNIELDTSESNQGKKVSAIRPTHCTECNKRIVFLKTKSGNSMPVDYSSLTGADLHKISSGLVVMYRYGVHVSHFATCSNPSRFRKKK